MKFRWHLLVVLIIYLAAVFVPKEFPPAFNADEAAFGYNAYSLAETGRDEYGALLPLRLKSFGDYKLPLYSYLSVPVVKAFGLTETSTRLLAKMTGLFLIVAIYWLTWELFQRQKIALIAALFASVSAWIQIFANHAHETTLATLLVALSLASLLRFARTKKPSAWGWSLLLSALSLFSYHSAKVIFPFLFLWQVYYLWQYLRTGKAMKPAGAYILAIASAVILAAFAYGEIKTPAARVKNLLLFTHPNISLITDEANTEKRFSPFGQRLFVAGREFVNRHLSYFSPEFLLVKGDQNPRFGLENLSPLTYIEFLGFFVGLIYLVSARHRYAWLIGSLLIAIPLTGSLSWQQYSLSRTHSLIILFLPVAAFGLNSLLAKRPMLLYLSVLFSFVLSLTSLFFLFYHYPKRGVAIRSWQAGYRELASYLEANYHRFDRFYVTRKNGQPYIMALFYLNYPPGKYQAMAELSAPDEYGFGQVEAFDKFVFNFQTPDATKAAVYVGYPDDFSETDNPPGGFKRIVIRNEEMFRIFEGRAK